jgi:hypothetical protein
MDKENGNLKRKGEHKGEDTRGSKKNNENGRGESIILERSGFKKKKKNFRTM